jgi:hypothetical protein
MSPPGTKRARAYATDVRSWWMLTYERLEGIRVLTLNRHEREDFAAMHNRRRLECDILSSPGVSAGGEAP